MLSCSIRFSAPSFWMGGGLENRCVGRVCGADVAEHGDIIRYKIAYANPPPCYVLGKLPILLASCFSSNLKGKFVV